MSSPEAACLTDKSPESFGVETLLDALEHTAPFPYSDVNREYDDVVPGYQDVFLRKQPRIDPRSSSLYVLLGPSGVGQDTLLDAMSAADFSYTRIRTGTTRTPRIGEDERSYVWMEDDMRGTDAEIVGRLTLKYGLYECQRYGEAFYGTPAQSVEEATLAHPGLPMLLKNEVAGAEKIIKYAAGRFNVVTLALVPESYRQIWGRINNRDFKLGRMMEAFKFAIEAPRIANYVIRNRESGVSRAESIAATASQIMRLITSIERHNA
jgi:guanylate kinase